MQPQAFSHKWRPLCVNPEKHTETQTILTMIYSNMCISALQDCSQMAVLHPCARRRLEMQIIQRARESLGSFVSAKQPTEEVFAVCVSNLQKKHLKGDFDTDITIFFLKSGQFLQAVHNKCHNSETRNRPSFQKLQDPND